MSKLDDLFRDGLGARKADVPNTNDLWNRVNAARNAPPPSGEALDKTFRDGLRDRQAPVPAGMWARIAAARTRRPLTRWFAAAAALLLLLVAGGIGYNTMGSAPVNTTFMTTTVAHDAEEATESSVPAEVPADDTSEQLPDGPTQHPPAHSDSITFDGEENRAGNGTAINTEPATYTGPSAPDIAEAPDFKPSSTTDDNASSVIRQELSSTLTAVAPVVGTLVVSEITPPKAALPAVTVIPAKFRSTSALRGLQTELLFGVSYANQQLTATDGTATTLSELRANSEFPVAGYQITLRTSHRFNDRLRLLAGLTYAEIRNELDYNRILNGQSVRLSTNNHIRMLEAPVLAGYTIPGRRLNVTVNAGPVINLTTSARGRFLSPDSALPLDLATEGNLRRNVGVGFMTSLTTAYQIGKKRPFTLLIEPFFKAYPTAFTVKDAPLRENYWVAGLQFGVRKSL